MLTAITSVLEKSDNGRSFDDMDLNFDSDKILYGVCFESEEIKIIPSYPPSFWFCVLFIDIFVLSMFLKYDFKRSIDNFSNSSQKSCAKLIILHSFLKSQTLFIQKPMDNF